MSDLTSIKELNANLKRVIYDEIESYAKQSGQSIRYMELPDNLQVRVQYNGTVALNFSVSVLIEDEEQ